MVIVAMKISLVLLSIVAALLPSATATPVPFTESDVERMRLEGRSEHDIATLLSRGGSIAMTPAYALSASPSSSPSSFPFSSAADLKKHILDFMATHHRKRGVEAKTENVEGLEERIKAFIAEELVRGGDGSEGEGVE